MIWLEQLPRAHTAFMLEVRRLMLPHEHHLNCRDSKGRTCLFSGPASAAFMNFIMFDTSGGVTVCTPVQWLGLWLNFKFKLLGSRFSLKSCPCCCFQFNKLFWFLDGKILPNQFRCCDVKTSLFSFNMSLASVSRFIWKRRSQLKNGKNTYYPLACNIHLDCFGVSCSGLEICAVNMSASCILFHCADGTVHLLKDGG